MKRLLEYQWRSMSHKDDDEIRKILEKVLDKNEDGK